MNTVIKKLLLEIMSFKNTRKFEEGDIYVKKAFKKLGEDILVSRLGELLHWINPRFHFSFTDLEKYVIYEDFMEQDVIKEISDEFALVFKHLPELNEIFVFKELQVQFNPSLNKSDIQEIYDFVKTNYVINPKHTSRYIRSSED
jgi:hypothetical protein